MTEPEPLTSGSDNPRYIRQPQRTGTGTDEYADPLCVCRHPADRHGAVSCRKCGCTEWRPATASDFEPDLDRVDAEDVPELLGEVRQLRARVAELEAEVRGLREQHPRKALGPHMVRLERTVLERDRLAARVAELEAEVARHAVARGAILAPDEAAELLATMTARGDTANAALTGARDALRLVERDRGHWRAAVERVRALHGGDHVCAVWHPGGAHWVSRFKAGVRCPTVRTLDAAGTPAEVPTTGPKAPTSARQDVGTPALVHQIKSIADRVLTLRPVPATRPSAYEEGWLDAVDAVLDALDDARDLLLDATGTPATPEPEPHVVTVTADTGPAVAALRALGTRPEEPPQ